MKIIVVKNSPVYNQVRVVKFLNYFKSKGYIVKFLCWLRDEKDRDLTGEEKYLLKGGGYANWELAFYYPLWIIKLFFYSILKKDFKDSLVFVIDFDSAFPIYLASLFRKKIKYIYDIHDDFAIRYRFPNLIKKIVSNIDYLVKANAIRVIHVDECRVREKDKNYEIIYNTPDDFYHGTFEYNFGNRLRVFVVSGLLIKNRGIESIYKFALSNPTLRFIVAGKTVDDAAKKLTELDNVNYTGFINQKELFNLIKNSCGIFSLYDPSYEINRLAASNKLYDAMMLGIPVIVNNGILAEKFVKENKIGFVINYDFDKSWNILTDIKIKKINELGQNGRHIYEGKFSYKKNIVEKLDGIFQNIF